MKKANQMIPVALSKEAYQEEITYSRTAPSLDQTLLLTVKQAAALLNLSIATVYRLIQTEEIPSLLIRGSRRLSRETLQQWIREQQSC
jgi:excisionase family DNA binding protein